MDTHTYFKVNRYEIEADEFALHLMYSDEDVAIFFDMSAEVFANAAGVSTEAALSRMKTVDFKALAPAGVLGDGDP